MTYRLAVKGTPGQAITEAERRGFRVNAFEASSFGASLLLATTDRPLEPYHWLAADGPPPYRTGTLLWFTELDADKAA